MEFLIEEWEKTAVAFETTAPVKIDVAQALRLCVKDLRKFEKDISPSAECFTEAELVKAASEDFYISACTHNRLRVQMGISVFGDSPVLTTNSGIVCLDEVKNNYSDFRLETCKGDPIPRSALKD